MFRVNFLTVLLLAPGMAVADPLPFLRDIAQITALERIRLNAAAAEQDDAVERTAEIDLPLVAASLSALEPALAEAVARGDPEAALRVKTLLEEDSAADPRQRSAGVIAALLLPEGGVAEAYEEAITGDDDEWALAHESLARVRELTAPLLTDMTSAQRDRAQGALDRLTAAIPALPPPYAEMLPGGEIEFETQVLASTLLTATGAPGWLGEDLPGAARVVQTLADQGCADADPARGRETLAIAAFWHEDALSGVLSLFAPDALRVTENAFDQIATDGVSPAACTALTEAMAEAHPMVGG